MYAFPQYINTNSKKAIRKHDYIIIFLVGFLFCATIKHSHDRVYTWSRHDVLFSTCIANHFLYAPAPNDVLQGLPKCFEPTQILSYVLCMFLTSCKRTTLSLPLLRWCIIIANYLFNIDPRALILRSLICRSPRSPRDSFVFGSFRPHGCRLLFVKWHSWWIVLIIW